MCLVAQSSPTLWPHGLEPTRLLCPLGILPARILEWVAMPSFWGSSQPRDRTQVSCIIGRFFTIWATREAHSLYKQDNIQSKTPFCCSSVAQSCLTLCDPRDCIMPGFPILHHLPELAQTYVQWVSDAIQTSHPLSSPSPPAFNFPWNVIQIYGAFFFPSM